MEVSPVANVHDSQGNVCLPSPMCSDPVAAVGCHEYDDKDMKIIDFGLAVFEHSHHPPVVGTRAYSPPEIVLGKCLYYRVHASLLCARDDVLLIFFRPFLEYTARYMGTCLCVDGLIYRSYDFQVT